MVWGYHFWVILARVLRHGGKSETYEKPCITLGKARFLRVTGVLVVPFGSRFDLLFSHISKPSKINVYSIHERDRVVQPPGPLSPSDFLSL